MLYIRKTDVYIYIEKKFSIWTINTVFEILKKIKETKNILKSWWWIEFVEILCRIIDLPQTNFHSILYLENDQKSKLISRMI